MNLEEFTEEGLEKYLENAILESLSSSRVIPYNEGDGFKYLENLSEQYRRLSNPSVTATTMPVTASN